MLYAQRAAPPPGGEPDEFVLSDGSIDRMGDVIEPTGWQLERIKSDPVVLFNHDRNQIVGKWINVRVKDGQLVGRIAWTNSDKWPFAQYLRDLVREGILRTVSVGFQPIAKEPLTKEADVKRGPFRFTKQDLLECSLVSVPANPNALALAKDFPREAVAAIFRKPASEDLGEVPAAHAKSGKSPSLSTRTKMQTHTIAQKIQAAQQEYNILRDALNELSAQDEMSAEEVKRYEELPAQIEVAKREIEKHKRAERALFDDSASNGHDGEVISPPPATPSTPMPKAPTTIDMEGRRLFAIPKKKVEAGDYTFRALACWTKSHANKDPLEKSLREMYGGDELTGMVLRAAVNPAMTTVATWAAELVQTSNVDFLDRLMPSSIYAPLAAAGVRYSFGRAGVLRIPVRANTPTVAGNWVGEGAPKPVRRISLSTVSMTPTKMAVISTFTEEMANYSTPSIEGIIRQAMSDDTSEALDSYLIDAVAASAVRPAGLLNGVTPITASAATPATAAMVADLKALVGAITAAGGGRRVVVIMNPAQALSLAFAQTTTGDFLFTNVAEAGNKFGVSFIQSKTCPAGRLIAVDAADFATANGDAPQFAVSTEATLHEEDTTPLALGSTGSPNTVAAPMRSLFQTDAVAIRLSLYISWVMRRASMVQTIASVSW
jgi:HK97 family phage major capsid protein/HK97 family phage prohead protease